jgi:16S rRNA G527 N7-methylase RsmG
MESVHQRKHKVNLEISDLRARITTLKSNKLAVDLVVIRALALKVVDLQKELDVIDVMLH